MCVIGSLVTTHILFVLMTHDFFVTPLFFLPHVTRGHSPFCAFFFQTAFSFGTIDLGEQQKNQSFTGQNQKRACGAQNSAVLLPSAHQQSSGSVSSASGRQNLERACAEPILTDAMGVALWPMTPKEAMKYCMSLLDTWSEIQTLRMNSAYNDLSLQFVPGCTMHKNKNEMR